MIVTGTGHRPPRLGLGYTKDDRKLLAGFAKSVLVKMLPEVKEVVTGGAQGWDQALAHAAAVLRIPYAVYVPFVGQEKKWPQDAQEYYGRLLGKAARVVVVSTGGYSPDKFLRRDERMVDDAQMVLALMDSGASSSGTRKTVEYAIKCKVRVINVWDEWVSYVRGPSGSQPSIPRLAGLAEVAALMG